MGQIKEGVPGSCQPFHGDLRGKGHGHKDDSEGGYNDE
ncbi:hypothetical protein HNQ56_001716 [Anaerotaenia torta]